MMKVKLMAVLSKRDHWPIPYSTISYIKKILSENDDNDE